MPIYFSFKGMCSQGIHRSFMVAFAWFVNFISVRSIASEILHIQNVLSVAELQTSKARTWITKLGYDISIQNRINRIVAINGLP